MEVADYTVDIEVAPADYAFRVAVELGGEYNPAHAGCEDGDDQCRQDVFRTNHEYSP